MFYYILRVFIMENKFYVHNAIRPTETSQYFTTKTRKTKQKEQGKKTGLAFK
jgi:hypothetical protein